MNLRREITVIHREVIYKNILTNYEAETAEVAFYKILIILGQKEYRFAFELPDGIINNIKAIAMCNIAIGSLKDIAKIEYADVGDVTEKM